MPAGPLDACPANTVIFRKTKICKFNMVGRCMRGGFCNFAHSDAELEPLPDFHFTKMCPSLCETGRCDLGAACTFAHKESELRAPTKGPAQGTVAHAAPTAAWTPATAWTTPAAAQTPMAPQRATAPQAPMVPQTPTAPQRATAPQAPMALRTPMAPQAPTPLISMQSVLAGMGVVLLQVLPAHTAFEEQVDRNQHDDEDRCSDISDADELDLATCDGANGWSRQSTEEGVEEPSGEFSRQSSEKSAWGLEEVEETVRREEVRLGDAFRGDGLTYVVKNTFLQFEDREVPLPVLRRVSSMGDVAVRSEGFKESVRGVTEEQSHVLPAYTAPDEQRDADELSEISDVDLEFSKCNDGPSGWSRQSTEEGFESGEFSRQSSEESSWGLQEVPAEQSKAEATVVQEATRLGNSFRGDGLAYVVKNSFLQFEDQEEPLPIIRRVSSTGSCAVRGL